MSMVINIKCRKDDFNSTEMHSRVNHSVKRATKYLVAEGFVKDTSGWDVEINVVGHDGDSHDTYDSGCEEV